MSYTRRSVLGLTSLSMAGLSGCIGNLLPGSESEATTTPSQPSNQTPKPTEAATATPTETATPTPTPASPVVERTGNIMEQIRWFARDYDRAMLRYQLRASEVKEQIRQMRKAGTITIDDVSVLQERTDAFGAYVSNALAPHFQLDDTLKSGGRAYVQQLQRAVEVGDEGEQTRVIGILSGYYDSVTSDTYIAKNISREPIREPLQDLLFVSGGGLVGVSYPGTGLSTFTYSYEYPVDEDDGSIDGHTHGWPTGHRLYAHSHDHGSNHDIYDHEGKNSEPDSGMVYVFKDGAVDILKDTELWRERMGDYKPAYTDVFGPVSQGQDRDDRAYLVVNDRSKGFVQHPLYVQQYADADAASAAFDSLFEGRVTKIGPRDLAGRTWTKSFYNTAGGPSIYLDVIQLGPFVVASAPSPKPYDRRPEWPEQMKRTWLAMEESSGEQGS